MRIASVASAVDVRPARAATRPAEEPGEEAAAPAVDRAALPKAKSAAGSGRSDDWRPALWPEAIGAFFAGLMETIRAAFRRGWIYRSSFRGPITDRVEFAPLDLRLRKLDEADAYFRGRFRFAGHTLEAKNRSIFDCELPGPGFAEALHGFEWLRHLEAAGGDAARALALKLAGEWLERYAHYTKPAWQPEIIALRFVNIFTHSRFFIVNSDLVWRSRFFVSLRNQSRVLARTAARAPDGLPRLRAAAALSLAGLCLSDGRTADLGLKRLADEIGRQILPDGGHVSRSPEALAEAFHLLDLVQQCLEAANRETQTALRSALDRMTPMVRFFRMGDGALSVFNGGGEGDVRLIAALLERDDVQGRPFGHAPHSAYQRLAAGRTLVLMDVGAPPPADQALRAHAGCLSFELSAGTHRLVVNCGAAANDGESWAAALRATAAHSALAMADTSTAAVLAPGFLRNSLGPRLIAEEGAVQTKRAESAQGIVVEARHDYYARRFGAIHERDLALSPKGLLLTGTDRLIPAGSRSSRRANARLFAIRFHIHPDLRLSLAQGGGAVILKLPNGEGWRFRCAGGSLSLEESVYLGGGNLRRSEQLVIEGEFRGEPLEIVWLFEQIGAT